MSIVYGVYGVVVVRELYFLKAWKKTMTANKTMMLRRTTQLLKKIQESCKKNFEDEANNKTKQLESIVSKPAGL